MGAGNMVQGHARHIADHLWMASSLNFRNTIILIRYMHFLDLMQPCLWTKCILESHWKRVLLSPGKPWNLVFPSPEKSWKTVFYCLYEPCNNVLHKPLNCLLLSPIHQQFSIAADDTDDIQWCLFVEQSKRQLLVQRRGAMLALTAIARCAGAYLQQKLPSFWDTVFGPVAAVSSKQNFFVFYLGKFWRVRTFNKILILCRRLIYLNTLKFTVYYVQQLCHSCLFYLFLDSVMKECDVTQAQELVNSLQVLQIVVPDMHSSLHPQVILPYLFFFCRFYKQ